MRRINAARAWANGLLEREAVWLSVHALASRETLEYRSMPRGIGLDGLTLRSTT